MLVYYVRYCDFCALVITHGQKFKEIEVPNNRTLHYHSTPFLDQQHSCFQKHECKEYAHVT